MYVPLCPRVKQWVENPSFGATFQTMLHHYSMLDLSPIVEGGTAADALNNSIDLAKHAEELGYHRYWMAEHHNMPGIASSATAVMIGQVAAATTTIRVGSGGIMLPNHSPLMVAEQFGTLASLFPDRIDLGLGRAPGTDMNTARALRRHMQAGDHFPNDVSDLLGYFGETSNDTKVRAIPGEGTHVPIWILGSSLGGAQVAAHFGLPYAFASHFAPQMIVEALHVYRTNFKPSAYLKRPYAMIAAGVCGAETDEEAKYLRTSQMLGFARLRTGKPGKLPYPVDDISEHITPAVRSVVDEAFSVSAVGNPETIRKHLGQIVELYEPDEIMLTSMMHDHESRVKSFAIAAEAMKDILN
jgi:luciferase family oxidoreductase group 1